MKLYKLYLVMKGATTMAKSLSQIINEESLNAVANVGGSYDDFTHWNYILAMYGLEPIA